MTRLLCSILLVVALAFSSTASVALASDGWCDTDPIVLIRTPAGNLVPVFVTVGAQNAVFIPNTLLGSLVLSYTAVPTSDKSATKVTLVVSVPSLPLNSTFATRATVSAEMFGTGRVYARGSGVSGSPITSTFVLPYP